MEQQQRDDFTRGSIVAKLSGFMLPILGALILQAMYGAVDILVVGRFGSTAGLSGVSTGSNIVNLVTFTVTGLSMGITVLIGRYIGEKRQEQVGRVIGGAICFFAVLSIAFSGVLLIFARQLALLMQAPAEAVELTVVYVQICGGGLLFIVAYNVISSIFRGMGNSRLPLIFVAIACGTNIVGDLLFVAVFHMNVAGAALATVLAQAVSVALSLIIIRRQKLPFEMKKRDICFNPEIGKFIKVGIPIAFQEILTQFYHAGSRSPDAIHVSFCGSECRGGKRAARPARYGCGDGHGSGDRSFYLSIGVLPRRSAGSDVYPGCGSGGQGGRISAGFQHRGGGNQHSLQLHWLL